MKTPEELNEEILNRVGGGIGMANPVAGMTFDQAFEIAKTLYRGEGRGALETMGPIEFMEWWMESNPGQRCPIDVYDYFR